jgi:hypothetical protein
MCRVARATIQGGRRLLLVCRRCKDTVRASLSVPLHCMPFSVIYLSSNHHPPCQVLKRLTCPNASAVAA